MLQSKGRRHKQLIDAKKKEKNGLKKKQKTASDVVFSKYQVRVFVCLFFSSHDFFWLILQCQSPFCLLWRWQHASGVILKLQLSAYQDSLAFLNMLPAFSVMGLVVEHFEDFFESQLNTFQIRILFDGSHMQAVFLSSRRKSWMFRSTRNFTQESIFSAWEKCNQVLV